MKKSHIIAIILLAIAAAIIFSTGEEASEYVDFATAKEMAKNGKTNNIHVVGTLPKDAQGNILGMKYQPTVNPNYFEFELIDEKGLKETAYFFNPKPADLDKSEKVVIIGGYQKGKFIVSEVLLKCPSKYEETEVK
ncbi:MAG: cytochrome c maturation protein CcmE [Cytophagales bacterium]|nr:cytochrome c maturation protein CcmE [Cytophagales bacterium]